MKENKFGLLLPLAAGIVMGASADVRTALAMGCAVAVTLLLTALVMYALRKAVPAQGLVPAYLLVAVGFGSLTQMLMQAHFPNVTGMLGVHLATMAIAALPFCEEAGAAGRKTLGKTVGAVLAAAAKFLALLLVCAVVREVLGKGSFFGMPIAFLSDYRISALAGAFGGYLVLASVLAACNAVANRAADHKKEEAQV